eukprot:jgi/Ulvmu1/4574/UM002_0302.1
MATSVKGLSLNAQAATPQRSPGISSPRGRAPPGIDMAPEVEDSRVRGRTAARDACHAAAVEGQKVDLSAGAESTTEARDRGQLGFKTNLYDLYDVMKEVGRGANGIVSQVQHKASGRMFACKTIPKVPSPTLTAEKQQEHVANIRREISVMKELSSCLNVAKLEDVFEDQSHVHIVQELCLGGELEHSIGRTHYSERTVASYMRAVLKTLAQCHVHNILHRDIKPGNFMLVSNEEDARIKAIDFGLAVPFQEGDDLTSLTMEGTPWFLAPETLSSKWSTKADIWAAGVMAFQLLTGRLPFNDKRNPHNPALSAVLRSILTDKLDFNRAYWQDISEEGRDFVRLLLTRDVDSRPTAVEALGHPWLQGDVSDRQKGKPLSFQVVQRVQRFGRNNLLRRSLLHLMVAELMKDEAQPNDVPSCPLDAKGRPVMDSPNAQAVANVLKYLNLQGKTEVTHAELAKGLKKMGYKLNDEEILRLMQSIGGGQDTVSRATLIASQIDWQYLQRFQKDRWLTIAQRAFEHIDADADGKVTAGELLGALESHIPADELNELYGECAGEAGGIPAARSGMMAGHAMRPMSFRSFMTLLRQPSEDSLDLYEDRYEGTGTMDASGSRGSTVGRLVAAAGDGSVKLGHDLEARREASVHRKDGTNRGRDLATVFEKGV